MGFMEKGYFMNIFSVGLLFFLVFSSSETLSDITLMAIDLAEIHRNMSLSSFGTDNGSEVFILHGGRLIDGTGSPLKSDAAVIINGNNIIAARNQSEYLNHYFNQSNGKQTGIRFLNLTGKYIMPGLFHMHAHV